MREKTPSERRPALPELPLQLRQFGTVYDRGRGYGIDVYPDRAAWVAARRAWSATHGMTPRRWWDAVLAAAELNEPFTEELWVEDDEDDDPRLTS